MLLEQFFIILITNFLLFQSAIKSGFWYFIIFTTAPSPPQKIPTNLWLLLVFYAYFVNNFNLSVVRNLLIKKPNLRRWMRPNGYLFEYNTQL